MKKIILGAVVVFSLLGCGKESTDLSQINSFLTDLSQLNVSDFAGPNPSDIVKIDFAVRKICLENPNSIVKDGRNNCYVDIANVHKMSDAYFDYPILKDQYTSAIDCVAGQYSIMEAELKLNNYVFTKVNKVLAERNDTILVLADTYECNLGWNGNINDDVESWKSVDENNVPKKGKTIRAVLLKKDDGLRIISYKTEN